jgi:uncharacterized protein YmfQ (DUF2313 family)
MIPRDRDAVLEETLAIDPAGWLMPAEDGVYAAILSAFASGVARLEADAAQLLDEIDPRTALYCLPDYERVLGPDPCRPDGAVLSLEARRMSAHQRWTSRGGASIAYFIALAAKRGIAITITEQVATCAFGGDGAVAGDELIMPPEQFCWTVHVPSPLDEFIAIAGEAQAGDLLYDFTLSDIECDIRRRAPAHTSVAFDYSGGP